VEDCAAKARPRARARLGRETISRAVGWETGRLSKMNAGATKREGATGADGVLEEASAGG
jgi:hypothetical protein